MAVNTKMPLTNTADGYLCEGTDIRGGYFVIDKVKNIPNTIAKTGSLCFCQEDSKFYQYNGTEWIKALIIPSTDGLASKDFVDTAIKDKIDSSELEKYYTKIQTNEILLDYAKKTDLPDTSSFISEIPSEYITESELNDKGYLTEHQDLSNYATKTYVTTEITKAVTEGKVDLTGYATEDYVNKAIEAIPDIDLSEYAKLTDIPEISDFITNIPKEYITESELEAKGYLTEHQSLDHLALKEHEHSEYLTEHQSLEHLALKEHTHDEYLTEHQSLENYYTKSEVDEAIENIDIPEVDLTNYITKEQLEEKKYLTSDDIGTQVTYSFSDGTLIITSK